MAAAIVAAIARRRSLTSISISNNHATLFSKSPFYYYYYYYDYQFYSTSSSLAPSNITPPSLVCSEDYFVAKYQFSPQIATKIVSASARMKNPQNADFVLSFLRENGFSNAHLERIVRHHSELLLSCPEKRFKPKLQIFQDVGFSAAEATHLIGRDLTILLSQPERIIHSLSVFKSLLGSNDNVIKLIKRCGSLLYADPEKTILPNIEFLKECGVQMDQINSCIYSCTRLFWQSPENMRRCVHKVDEMGVERTSRMFIYAVEAVSRLSEETLKLRLKSLKDLGFSEDDILRVFRTAPVVICTSTHKIKEVKEVLLETGKYDMSCIIKNPTSLARSVEKRYKPRLQVLKELERKGLITKWPGLSKLGSITNESFIEKFVAPNINEVGEEFTAMAAGRKLETATCLKPS